VRFVLKTEECLHGVSRMAINIYGVCTCNALDFWGDGICFLQVGGTGGKADVEHGDRVPLLNS
jgi:hypothetical protein